MANTAPTTRQYAEHERLALIKDKSQAIGEFLEWLRNEQVRFARHHEHDESCDFGCSDWLESHEYAYMPVENLLAKYFGIDLNKLEQEKRQMLADLRLAHAKKEIEKELGL